MACVNTAGEREVKTVSPAEPTASLLLWGGSRFVDPSSFGTLSTAAVSFVLVVATADSIGFGADSRMTRELGLGADSLALPELLAGLALHSPGDTCLASVFELTVLAFPPVNRPEPGMIASPTGLEEIGEIGSCFRASAACGQVDRG